MQMENKKYLNLGCGLRFLRDWVNVDFVSTGPDVIAHNLLKGIPFPDNSFDVVYHSHILEHFSKEHASIFIKECFRVLRPGGILRVAVPDLERIVKEYIYFLGKALQGDKVAQNNYEWIMLELYDQSVRTTSGGNMVEYWTRPDIPNADYIESRLGDEFISFREKLKGEQPWESSRSRPSIKRFLQLKYYKNKLLEWLLADSEILHEVQIAKFRMKGEVHQWMYDRYSLATLLHNEGFIDVREVMANGSRMPDWEKNRSLDIENGKVRKPESLFMEATK